MVPGASQPSIASPSSDLCDAVDACASDKKGLSRAEQWLGDRLTGAGLRYRNGYRADGGGGHVNLRWGFQIWVLRPTRASPELEASRKEHKPLWSAEGITVFGSARPGSPVAYFFWRAGGVDTWVELDWAGSKAGQPEDLREVFGRIIQAQQRHPYPYAG
jgi:hypothetical protein